jgi:hypothetical protein
MIASERPQYGSTAAAIENRRMSRRFSRSRRIFVSLRPPLAIQLSGVAFEH